MTISAISYRLALTCVLTAVLLALGRGRVCAAVTVHTYSYNVDGALTAITTHLEWLILMKEELGDEWLSPHLFRFGASSLLGDIERQLEHFVTGRYSAAYRHPMA